LSDLTVLKFGRQISVNNTSKNFHRNVSHDYHVFSGGKTDGRTYGRSDVASPIVVFRKVLWMCMEVKHFLYFNFFP